MSARCGPGCGYCGRCTAAWERDDDPAHDDDDNQPLADVMENTQALLDVLDDQIRELARRVEVLLAERAHSVAVLTAFIEVPQLAEQLRKKTSCL